MREKTKESMFFKKTNNWTKDQSKKAKIDLIRKGKSGQSYILNCK